MRPFRFLAPLLAALAAPFASAQNVNVFVVDAAGGAGSAFTEIQPAIDAAASGDLVLVRSGSYSGFSVVAKSLSIVADAGATVDVNSSSRISLLGADQRVEVVNLQLKNEQILTGGPVPPPPLTISSCAGIVWLEHVDALAQLGLYTPSISGLVVSNCDSVVLLRCTVRAVATFLFNPGPGTSGLIASNSTLAIHDGTYEGAGSVTPTAGSPSPGAPGASLLGGFAFASGATFKGGKGGNGLTSAGSGGPGVLANGTFVGLDCTFIGGQGGISDGSWQAPPGPPTAGSGPITTLAGTARHFEITSPVRELQSATLHFKGLPGENACALLSDLSDPVFFFGPLDGALCVSLGNVNALLFGVIAPSGAVDVAIPMPDFLPSLMGGRIYFQSFFFDPAVTYVVLGPPSLFVLLDSGL